MHQTPKIQSFHLSWNKGSVTKHTKGRGDQENSIWQRFTHGCPQKIFSRGGQIHTRSQDFLRQGACTFFLKKVDDPFLIVALKHRPKLLNEPIRPSKSSAQQKRVYWAFDCNCWYTKHFTTFPGGKSPLPMPAGAHGFTFYFSFIDIVKTQSKWIASFNSRAADSLTSSLSVRYPTCDNWWLQNIQG